MVVGTGRPRPLAAVPARLILRLSSSDHGLRPRCYASSSFLNAHKRPVRDPLYSFLQQPSAIEGSPAGLTGLYYLWTRDASRGRNQTIGHLVSCFHEKANGTRVEWDWGGLQRVLRRDVACRRMHAGQLRLCRE